MGLHWVLNDDRQTVTVSAGETVVAERYSAADIDILLANLRRIRDAMQPAVPMDFTVGQTIMTGVSDPRWMTELNAMDGSTVFHVRDPGYGWLTYNFPKPEVAQIISLFAKQLSAPPPASPPPGQNTH
jgi:hypothetical protein